MSRLIGDVPTLQQPPNKDLPELFNHDEMESFLIENKAEVCALLIGRLVDRIRVEGFTEVDLVRGMAAHCRARKFPKEIEFALLDAALKFNR